MSYLQVSLTPTRAPKISVSISLCLKWHVCIVRMHYNLVYDCTSLCMYPSRALVVLYRMLTIFACYVFDFYVWDAVSIFNHLPRMFLSTDFALRIKDWTCCHGPHLHAILRIISRGVSGLAILLAAFGAVDEPLASCMIVHFSDHFSKWKLVCKFGVLFHIFVIISCLGSWFHAWN